MFLKYTVIVINIASFVCGANILAVVPTPSYSHQVAFFDLWSQLSLRGHKVTLITADPQKNAKLTNLTEIDVKWSYDFLTDISKDAEEYLTTWNFHTWVANTSTTIARGQLSDPQVQELIHNKKNHFDVLLLEFYYLEYIGFAEIYNCPVILISSLEVSTDTHENLGNVVHPVLYTDIGSTLLAPFTFKERVMNTLNYLHKIYVYKYVFYPVKQETMQKFFNTTSTINELFNRVDMLLNSVSPVLQTIRAVGPNTIDVFGLRQISARPLPKDLETFLDSATNGFVYFSLGSNVKSKDLQKESLDAIIETLGELPYKVLWKFEAEPEAIPHKPDSVKLIKWAPQLGILAHPNIKAFVTQGGLQSMEEAIHFEVPCVVIPFFADQEQNSKLMKSKGFALTVGRHPYIKKEELKSAIIEVINDPKFKNSVRRLKQLASDTPMTGLEKAIWWTEYVIRNKGAKHLRNPAADLPLYQYYLLDVISFLLLVTVVALSTIFVVLRKIYNLFLVNSLKNRSIVNKKVD